ncbi:MAG: GNAT family N-acetyltransferase [bacterium]
MTRAELKTVRLTLRPVAPEDEGAVVAALNDIAVSGWLAVVPWPYAPADFQQFQTEYALPGDTFSVDDAQGFAGILGVEDRTLGYWFAPRCHGLGYATEAARAALAAHLAHDPEDIRSGYFEGNDRSANVLRKLGFRESGRGLKYCLALGIERPHVDMLLTRDAFTEALPIEAQSARLTYRALQNSDLEALHAVVSDWEVVRQLASFPWPPDRAFTATRAQPYLGRGFVWGVFLNRRLVGTVAVTGDELGYCLVPDVWRQGIGTEICRVAIDRAFGSGWDHLVAGVWADNAASIALLGKLGFRVVDHDLTLNKARGETVPGLWMRLERADWPRVSDGRPDA